MARMTITEAREYYKGKYKKVLNALEEIGVEVVNVNTKCYGYLEISCMPYGENDKYEHVFWANIGINNKYNCSWGSRCSWIGKVYRHSYTTQDDLARYIRIVGGKEKKPDWDYSGKWKC